MSKTTIWATCCLAGVLSGCASSRIDVPTCEVEKAPVAVQEPARLPPLPEPTSATDEAVTFSREGFQALLAYSVTAGGNQEVALANAEALEAQTQAYNELVDCSRLAHQMSQVREDQLDRERQEHQMDSWFYRGLIVLGILVAL